MTKTLNHIIFFFLHQNQNIFFSNIGYSNSCALRKKNSERNEKPRRNYFKWAPLTWNPGSAPVLLKRVSNIHSSNQLEWLSTPSFDNRFRTERGGRIFFPELIIRLYDKNSESHYFFFPPPKSEYFFQQHWESEYFFRKKKNPGSAPVLLKRVSNIHSSNQLEWLSTPSFDNRFRTERGGI
jgi:hypothetical protein